MNRRQITHNQAEAALTTVREQFATYITRCGHGPALYEPGFHDSCWTIAWDDGPFEWALRAFQGGFDVEAYRLAKGAGATPSAARERATTDQYPAPPGVFVEPVTTWCLGLYPAHDSDNMPVDEEPVEPVVIFTLIAARRGAASYGLVLESVETVDVAGRAAHSPHHPHRVHVWRDEQCTGGHGTHILGAEAVVIANTPVDRPPHLGTVREGNVIQLLYPDGRTADYTVTTPWLRDPTLVPLV